MSYNPALAPQELNDEPPGEKTMGESGEFLSGTSDTDDVMETNNGISDEVSQEKGQSTPASSGQLKREDETNEDKQQIPGQSSDPVKNDDGRNGDHQQRGPGESTSFHISCKINNVFLFERSENTFAFPISGWSFCPFGGRSSAFQIKYNKVVSGQTFGADQQIMKNVQAQLHSVARLSESRHDHQITILFCPITSRVGSDVEAAMSLVTDDKLVILVLMHHSREPKITTSVRTWDLDANYTKIVLHVDVFFHNTVDGLLQCHQNAAAVNQIKKKLQEFCSERKANTSGQSNEAAPDKSGKSRNASNPADCPTGDHPQREQGANTSACIGSVNRHDDPAGNHQQRDQDTLYYHDAMEKDAGSYRRGFGKLPPEDVKYKKVVSGQTFDADQQFMKKVKAQLQGVAQLSESRHDHQITVLFCPITSRVGSDVEAAMSQVTDDKPVILVLMHHSREPKITTSVRTWDLDANYTKIILHVEVFFHNTVHGLLQCHQNDAAVFQIHKKLQERMPPRQKGFPGKNKQGVDAKKAKPDGNDGGKDHCSDENSKQCNVM